MAMLTRAQLYGYGQAAGFKGAALDEVVAIALAESGGDTQHIHINPASSGWGGVNVPANTPDVGVLQINTWWNPSVTQAQAMDPTFAFQWAYKVTNGGQPGLFNAYWSTVKNGAYLKQLTPGGASTAIAPTKTATTPTSTTTTSSSTPPKTTTPATSATPTGTTPGGTVTATGKTGSAPVGLTHTGSGAYSLGGSGTTQPIATSMNTGPASTSSGLPAIVLVLVGIVIIGGLILFLVHRKKKPEEEGTQ